MTDQPIDQMDVARACNRITFPHGYETQGDTDKVQWAARRALAALDRLHLEIEIASARSIAARDTRSAKRNRALMGALIKSRANRP